MKYKYLFGPVPSRRLGISLGIDLLIDNICSFNCIYCECGRTHRQTMTREEFVPTADVIIEIDDYLHNFDIPDFITFSGSGEPTLHTGIGEIVSHIKSINSEIKVALLTNATLLSEPKVRKEISKIDVILPTINGILAESVKKISRPLGNFDSDKIIEGLISLRKEIKDINGDRKNEIWLAYFAVEGINTSEAELALAKEAILRIKPDRIQLNTLDRPAAETWVKPSSKEILEKIVKFWNLDTEHGIPVEIISKYRSRKEIRSYKVDIEHSILSTISRRPCTLEDISDSLMLHISEVSKYIDVLEKEKKISLKIEDRGVFFTKNH
ncbi:MAG: radical SAM protein [Planctomycetes bacterium]|nr:radical SAM protein [Planctomycetota bacterium]